MIIISNDGFNEAPGWRSVIVVPVTTSPRQAARGLTAVPISNPIPELAPNSIAVCHQITTLDRSKIDTRIGSVSRNDLQEIERGILAACDLAP